MHDLPTTQITPTRCREACPAALRWMGLLALAGRLLHSHAEPHSGPARTAKTSGKRHPKRHYEMINLQNRIRLLSAILLVVLCLPSAMRAEQTHGLTNKTRPNFIFLLVDDWGWKDAGCCGSDLYQTPHIDKLAGRSMRFTNGYAACTVCSPTRAAIMTGMYPARLRVTDWITGHVRRNAKLQVPDWTQKLEHRHVTIAEALQTAGYKTAHVGKWHLMPRGDADVDQYSPEHHGFHLNIGGNDWGAPGSYFHPYEGRNRRVEPLPPGGKEGDYLTDRLTDEAIKIINGFKDEPFFLYFAYYNVHTPLQAKADVIKEYKARIKPGMQHRNPTYAAMVEAVDDSVGRITTELQRLGLDENTVIFLTGDNGGLDRNGNPTDNAPLRAGKGSAYEGGVRVPTFVRWPGVADKGSTCDEPVISIDYYPTILEIAGVEGDATHNNSIDGVSLTPLLRGNSIPERAIFWHYPHYHPGGATPYSAVRKGDWKLVQFYEDGRSETFRLDNDRGETTDLSQPSEQRSKELIAELDEWRQNVNAQAPIGFNKKAASSR